MELGIPFGKTVTHRIFVIYLDQANLEASMCKCYALNRPCEFFFH
jgi:hypothetical protein